MNRGDWLERTVEICNKQYKLNKKARIDKIATPVSLNPKKGTAYFSKKSTVDFTGFTKKGPVAFDAKETSIDNFPFKNVHDHQLEYLNEVYHDYGVDAFLLIWFKKKQEMYKVDIVTYKKAVSYFKRSKNRKSIPYSWFPQNATRIKLGKFVYFDYLELEG